MSTITHPVQLSPTIPAHRIHARHAMIQKVNFDFFTLGTGRKQGFITDVSLGGCMMRSSEALDARRWLRLLIQDDDKKLGFSLVGRIVRRENKLETTGDEITLYRYGVEFTFPEILSNQDLDLILDLSSKNFNVRSCLIRNNKSSLRSEFLA